MADWYAPRRKGVQCPSDYRLDQLVAGSLAATDAAPAREHIAGCPSCAARLAEFEAQKASFPSWAPPLLPSVPVRSRAWARPALLSALGAVAVVALLVVEAGPRSTDI